MKLYVNAKVREVTECTIAGALSELGLTNPAIATALNGEFVPKEQRSVTHVHDGDRLEVLTPMQGG